jgi:hypothetical protein
MREVKPTWLVEAVSNGHIELADSTDSMDYHKT